MSEFNDIIGIALRVWSFELFSIDGHPLSVGKLIAGVFLLVVGYWISGRAADGIERRFLRQMDVEASLRYTLRRVVFYFFFAIAALSTLRALNVPITVFTVLGGALAIGFGFGSQNIVNNFISGMILMIESPLRVSDYIEIEGLRGTVETIGIRATHIRTPENRQVIVPNSVLLEKPLVNWTLSDDVIRAKVSVGVAYGSDVNLVKSLLLQCCQKVTAILKDPPPRILFADFGDSALVFETLFWARMGHGMLIAEIESELRFCIDRAFQENKISIPFPQRDLHIFTQGGPGLPKSLDN